ncbi:hypothetical protein [Qipengyuania soli]|uniref:C-type lysozyme inhibitor domain-containing protein n=1 Tax=Qipengyuania soli TaxID=2782568 RepID=A0A7S8IUM5_9SPHN|nr:hypothetical protein [Qipengyuania soli]QPC99184.1 hypothetical protein IRL76_00945 [Qipengyuania soli]
MNHAALLSPLLPALFLAMAACSPGPDASGADEPVGAAGSGEAKASAQTSPTSSPTPVTAEEIPSTFLGVWDHDKPSCDVPSDMRLEIAPKSIRFYESRGEVTRIEVDSADSIVVSLAMEGEGEKWQMARKLDLSDDGNTLTESSVDEDRIDPIKLMRCDN